MIVLVCAIVSVGGAVLLAHRINSPKAARVVLVPQDQVSLSKEHSALSETLIVELDRMKAAKQKNPVDLDLAVRSFATIVRTSWDKRETYYDKKSITPFLNVLNASVALERNSMSVQYLDILKNAISRIVPDCSQAIIRGDDGDSVNDFTYKCMDTMDSFTSRLEEHNRFKLKGQA